MFKLARDKYIAALESAEELEKTLQKENENLGMSSKKLSENWWGTQAEISLRAINESLEISNHAKALAYTQGMTSIMGEYLPELEKMMAKREQIGQQLKQDEYVEPDLTSFSENELIVNYEYIDDIKADVEGALHYGDKAIEILEGMIEDAEECAGEYLDLSHVRELLEEGKKKLHRMENYRDEFVDFGRKMSDLEYNMSMDLSNVMRAQGDTTLLKNPTITSYIDNISRVKEIGEIDSAFVLKQSITELELNEDIGTSDNIVETEVHRWVGVTNEVAQAYVANVHTYCTRTESDPGYRTADKRKMYFLEGIGGNLEGMKVGDDCSSFVYACLIQAGYISQEDIVSWAPTSGNYFPGGCMEEILENAGFVWHSKSELNAEDIQQGDILVRDGHVEIFDRYEDGVEFAYTWGEIYDNEPTEKGYTIYTIWNDYEGVWRYEGK